MFSPSEEAPDEFDKYYSQFRPRHCPGSYSPASTSYYSSFSSQNNSGSGCGSGSDQYSFTTRSYRSPFQPVRSRSQSRGGSRPEPEVIKDN